MANWNLYRNSTIAAALAFLAGSGCGGGSQGGNNNLSTAQKNYEAAAVSASGYSTLKWNLPVAGASLISGIHYLYSVTDRLFQSPSDGDQAYAIERTSLSAEAILPDAGTLDQKRYLKDGAIYQRGNLDRVVTSFAGGNIEVDVYASDGETRLHIDVFDEWNAPIPLKGKISDDGVSRSHDPLLSAANSENIDLTKSWLPGAAYFKRKSYAGSDLLYVVDWTGSTSGTNVNPASYGTIEGWFGSTADSSAVADDIRYSLPDGTITRMEGVRIWVANDPLPFSVSPTEQRVVFFELNSRVYYGLLIKQGTRHKTLDKQDSATVLDYSIRYNREAVDSIAAAVKSLSAESAAFQGDTSDDNEV